MTKALLLQCIASLLGAALAGCLYGAQGALYAFLAGAAYWLPNVFFVMRLKFVTPASNQNAVGYVPVFLFGEIFKLVVASGLLLVIRFVFPDLIWPALILGLVVTVQANLFAFLFKIH